MTGYELSGLVTRIWFHSEAVWFRLAVLRTRQPNFPVHQVLELCAATFGLPRHLRYEI